jgi:hypothetical protein
MPASTSDTAARSVSASTFDSTCSGRLVAFISYSSVSLSDERGRPRTTKWIVPICPADFDRILANLRQWSFIIGRGRFDA